MGLAQDIFEFLEARDYGITNQHVDVRLRRRSTEPSQAEPHHPIRTHLEA